MKISKSALLMALLKHDSNVKVTVDGGCMRPILKEKDVISLKQCQMLRVGLIVVVKHNDRLVAHRIVDIDKGGKITTKGDHAYCHDENSGVVLSIVTANNTQCYSITLSSYSEIVAFFSHMSGCFFEDYTTASKGLQYKRMLNYIIRFIVRVMNLFEYAHMKYGKIRQKI